MKEDAIHVHPLFCTKSDRFTADFEICRLISLQYIFVSQSIWFYKLFC